MNFNYFQITFRIFIVLCMALMIFWICFRYHVIPNDNDALSNDTIDGCNDTTCDVLIFKTFFVLFFVFFYLRFLMKNINFQLFFLQETKAWKRLTSNPNSIVRTLPARAMEVVQDVVERVRVSIFFLFYK